MIPYLIAFAISAWFVQAVTDSGRGREGRFLLAALAVVPVSILAGIRDFAVGGPDTLLYGNPLFRISVQARDLAEVIDGAAALAIPGEYGYLTLNFLVSRMTDNPHWFYFVLAALTHGLVLAAILRLRQFGSASLMWLVYLGTCYVASYNLLRQSLAMSFGLLGLAFVLGGSRRLGVLIAAAGFLFHTSAVVAVVVCLVAGFLCRRHRRLGLASGIVLAACGCALVASPWLLDHLAGLLTDQKYASYLEEGAAEGAELGVDTLYRLVPLIVGAIVARRGLVRSPELGSAGPPVAGSGGGLRVATAAKPSTRLDTTSAAGRLLLVTWVLLAMELIILPIREVSYPFYRVPLYFGQVRVFGYALIAAQFTRYRTLASVGVVSFVAVYFCFVAMVANDGWFRSVWG